MATARSLCAICMLAVGLFAQDDVAALTQRLRAKDKADRVAAADKLAELGPKAAPAAKALGAMLADDDRSVSEAAARALAKIGKVAFPQIRVGLAERTAVIGAIHAIEMLGPEGSELVPDMLEAIRRFEMKEPIDAAIKAVKAMGGAAVPGLRQCLKVRVTAGYAAQLLLYLRKLAEPATPELMSLIADRSQGQARSDAASVIGAMGKLARKQAPKLIEYALDEREHEFFRGTVLRAVGDVGTDDPKVVEAVRSLLAAKDARLAETARRVLGQLR